MSFCCGVAAFANVQNYINFMHLHVLEIERDFKKYGRFQARIKSGSSDSMPKIQAEFSAFLEAFKAQITAFVGGMNDPYFAKVQLHYPEVAKGLRMCMAKITSRAAKL